MHPTLMLNAAIEQLINGDDATAESARVIISYGATLQCAGTFEISISFPWNKKGSTKGMTNELGNVQFEDKDTSQKEIGKLIKKERIGHYRIWKSAEGHLIFHHFWASEIETQSDDSAEVRKFHLFYDPLSLAEIGYAEEYVYRIRKISLFKGVFTHITTKLDTLYGSVPWRYQKRVLNRK